MKKCKEIIVVEGKNDISAIKRSIDAEVLAVGGFSVSTIEVLERIKKAQEKQGVIIFTDPDPAGERIRSVIARYVHGAKHAFIKRDVATRKKDGKIGVEHASKKEIIKALNEAKFEEIEIVEEFTIGDLLFLGLSGHPHSKELRFKLGEELGIGYANSKQFLRRLNHFGITKEDFLDALQKIFTELENKKEKLSFF